MPKFAPPEFFAADELRLKHDQWWRRAAALRVPSALGLLIAWAAAIYGVLALGAVGVVYLFATALLTALAAWWWLHARARVRLTEELLEKSEEQKICQILLDNLLESVPLSVYFKDESSRFIRISRALTELLGLKDEREAWGKTDLDMFASEHGEQAMRDEREIMRTGKPVLSFEEKENWEDGRERWVSTSKMPLYASDRKVIGTFGLSFDITSRKLAEIEVKRERELLFALMNNLPDPIYFKDRESRFIRVNVAHAALFGVSHPNELVGKSDADFFEPTFAKEARRLEEEIMSTGKTLEGRLEHDRRNDRFFLATKIPLRNEAGKVVGLVGVSKDLTERHRSKEKLEHELIAFLQVVDAAARGDLAQRGEEGPETLGRIAAAVNQMLQGFSATLHGVRDLALSVSTSSSELFATMTQIAKGSQHGSDQVMETSSAVEQMANSMMEVSRNAEQSATAAGEVLEHLRETEGAINAAVASMTLVDATAGETAEKMRTLERRSKQIFEIIALIEEIAGQSTLLSLNAAIAAAHAGDAGRGFGVVADEIRHLADRSSESAKQVSIIVQGIVGETRQVLSAMEKEARQVHGGREVSDQAQQSLHKIQALVNNSVLLSQQISRAANEQSLATQTVARAMQTISSITQQSSTGAVEATRAVRHLVSLSEKLTSSISHFKIAQ